MDRKWLEEGRRVARVLNGRIQMTIPSVLASGETFGLRVTAFGPDALPAVGLDEEIRFEGSEGIEGLPASARLSPDGGALLEIDGLKAAGTPSARVCATVGEWPIRSNPAWVFDEPPYRLWWGDLHVHTSYSNCQAWSCKDPEFGYVYARDVARLDFAAAADHLRGLAADETRWPRLQHLVRAYDQPGRFVPFLAFESSHKTGMGGDINAYYLGADGPYFWLDRPDMRGNGPAVPLRRLWDFLDSTGQEYLTIPHHTARVGKYRSFDAPDYDERREPLFEIYSAWGSSERPLSAYPLHAGNTDKPAYFVDALRAGARYGVIASSDDHTTLPGGESRNWGSAFGPMAVSGYHHMGLAAVRAPELTRQALWRGLRRRETYATTFDRTLLDVTLGELAMGQAATVGPADPLRKRRQVRVRFSLDQQAEAYVVLVRNGEDLARERLMWDRPVQPVEEVVFDDAEALDTVALRDAPFHPGPFVVYYVRVETPARQTQWSSPIWLDL